MVPFVNKKLHEMNKFSLKLAKCVVLRSFEERIFAPVFRTKNPSKRHLRPPPRTRGKIFSADRRSAERECVPTAKKIIPAKFPHLRRNPRRRRQMKKPRTDEIPHTAAKVRTRRFDRPHSRAICNYNNEEKRASPPADRRK